MKRNHKSPDHPASPVHPLHGGIRRVVVESAVLVVAACVMTVPLPDRSLEAIDRCLSDMVSRTGRALSLEADRAYVYVRRDTYWIYFTHGDSGTFGGRSDDYRTLLTCGIVRGRSPRVVFLGEPMADPVFDDPDRDAFVTPEGSTELLFRRTQGAFDFCCSQPFDRNNIDQEEGT